MGHREALGFACSTAFVVLAALRDVHLGGLFQHVPPATVAIVAFGLCSAAFLPLALVRDRAGLAALLRRPRALLWINVTSALPWLAFFHALSMSEPALAQVIFFGVGPLSAAWVDRLVGRRVPEVPSPAERRLHRGLLAALVAAVAVMATGLSALGPQPPGRVAAALALAVGGGILISINTVLCRTVNEAGVSPAALLALRFPGAVLLGVALAAAGGNLGAAIAPAAMLDVASAAFLLVVLPIYVNQIGIALASPLTVRVVLAAGPALVFALQVLEGRLPSSPFTLAVCVLYGAVALVAAAARRRAIAAGPRAGRIVTAAGR
jgi:hypothetical protein